LGFAAVIKAEINQAKNTFDLVHMADAIVRLDALHAEMEAASKSARMSCGDFGCAHGGVVGDIYGSIFSLEFSQRSCTIRKPCW